MRTPAWLCADCARRSSQPRPPAWADGRAQPLPAGAHAALVTAGVAWLSDGAVVDAWGLWEGRLDAAAMDQVRGLLSPRRLHPRPSRATRRGG